MCLSGIFSATTEVAMCFQEVGYSGIIILKLKVKRPEPNSPHRADEKKQSNCALRYMKARRIKVVVLMFSISSI